MLQEGFVSCDLCECCLSVVVFFFFKQKTAYERRISDWSSDACSSDLIVGASILMRYLFSAPILGGDEIVAISLTAIVMLAAPDVLRRNGHIGVDILDRKSVV